MFFRGKEYRRLKIHEKFGGNVQAGISTPSDYRLVFIFHSKRGNEYGYKDFWDKDGFFHYCGEGQIGDMKLQRGNKAIYKHQETRKDIHLFEQTRKGFVKYIDQMFYVNHYFEEGKDREGNKRQMIIFKLLPLMKIQNEFEEEEEIKINKELSLEELLEKYRLISKQNLEEKESISYYYRRSLLVKQITLKRANGVCLACKRKAPFITKNNRPYLEVHHIHKLSDGGPDSPNMVIALCPNCHRKAHYSLNSHEFNNHLLQIAKHFIVERHY